MMPMQSHMPHRKSCASAMRAAPKASSPFPVNRGRSSAAIAKHTNAFKINEDVVIPLGRLGDYTDGIERINIECSLKNKLELVDRLAAFFGGDEALRLAQDPDEGHGAAP